MKQLKITQFKRSILFGLVAVLLLSGIGFMGTVVRGKGPSVDTYNDSGFTHPDDDFAPLETVYFKAIHLDPTKYHMFRLDPPSGSGWSDIWIGSWVTGVAELTGSYALPSDAPVGKWTVHTRKSSSSDGSSNDHVVDADFYVSRRYYTASITPTFANTGETKTYTLNFTNYLSSTKKLGSVSAAIPSGWTGVTILGITFPPTKTWTADIDSGLIRAKADGGKELTAGQSVLITFSATAPPTPGVYEWTTLGYEGRGWRGFLFGLVGPQPTVTVSGGATVSITIASSPAGSDFVKVDGAPITTPHTYDWIVGSTHTLEALSPVADGAGVQYVYTGWSDIGAQTHTYTVPGSSETVTANYKTQFYVTFAQSGIGGDSGTNTVVTIGASPKQCSDLPVSDWFDSGTTYSYAAVVATSDPGKQYALTGVTGPTSPIAGTGTVTGNYKTQYSVTFAANPVGGGSTTPSGTQWLDAGSNPISASANAGYQFSKWTATGPISFGNQYLASTSASVGGSGAITANFNVSITIASSPAGSGFVEVDDTPITTPTTFYWEAGSVHKLEALSPVSLGPSKQYLFTGWSDAGAQTHDYTVPSAPETVTATYKIQVKITFDHTGLDGTASGTVVTVEGSPKTLADLAFTTDWLDSGGSISFTYAGVAASTDANKQFVLTSTSHASPLTIPNDPVTVYGHYKTQFYVTFDQSGIGGDSGTNTVVTIGGSPKKASDLPVSGWFDSGTTYSYAAVVATSDPGKQYVLEGVTGPTSPINAGGAVTGNYKTQYKVSFAQSGSAVPPTVTYTADTDPTTAVPFDVWVKSGTEITYAYQGIVDGAPGVRYVLISVSPPSPQTVSGPMTITGTYKTQYQVTFYQSGVGSDFTGTVAVVDASNYVRGDFPVSFWWDSGSTHNFAFQSPLVVTPDAKRYVWTSTSGLSSLQAGSILVSAAGGVTGNYKTQYYLTMSTNYGTVTPASGWYDAGTKVSISATAPAVIAGERYVWLGWTGTGTISYTGLLNPAINQVTMNGPVTEVAAWRREFLLTVFSDYDSPVPSVGEHWYPIGTVVNAFVLSPWLAPDETRYICSGWIGTGSVPASGTETSLIFSLMAPSNLTWVWTRQFYLTVTSMFSLASKPTIESSLANRFLISDNSDCTAATFFSSRALGLAAALPCISSNSPAMLCTRVRPLVQRAVASLLPAGLLPGDFVNISSSSSSTMTK